MTIRFPSSPISTPRPTEVSAPPSPVASNAVRDVFDIKTGTASIQREVVVVGGSLAGLTTALSLAKRGVAVTVLEARRDPNTAEGKAALALAAGHRQRANATTDEAVRKHELAQADAIARQFWGQRQRAQPADQVTLDLMASLDVDLGTVHPIGALREGSGDAGISVLLQRKHAVAGSPVGEWDPARLLLKRQVAAATTIDAWENRLRQALEALPNTQMKFGVPAAETREDANGIEVRDEHGAVAARGQVLVLADGGGGRSLSQKLGVTRQEVTRERMGLVVFQAPWNDAGKAWIENSSHAGDRFMLVGFDGKGLLSVIVDVGDETELDDVVALARTVAPELPLAESPVIFDAPIDRASDVSPSTRVLVVGDGAARVTPRRGLGGQFAMGSSQLAAAAILSSGDLSNGLAPESRDHFRQSLGTAIDMLHVTERRQDNLGAVLSGVAGSQSLNDAITQFGISFQQEDALGGTLSVHARIDMGLLTRGLPTKDAALATTFSEFGVVELFGAPRLSFAEGRVSLSFDRDHTLSLRSAIDHIEIHGGSLVIDREGFKTDGATQPGIHPPRGDRWELSLRDIAIKNQSRGQAVPSQFLGDVKVMLPLAFLTHAMSRTAQEITPVAPTGPAMQGALRLERGTLRLGSLRLNVKTPTDVTIHVEPGVRATFELSNGVELDDVSAGTLTRGLTRLASKLIRRIELDDEGAQLCIKSPVGSYVRLPRVSAGGQGGQISTLLARPELVDDLVTLRQILGSASLHLAPKA